jgi:hypothetical protein
MMAHYCHTTMDHIPYQPGPLPGLYEHQLLNSRASQKLTSIINTRWHHNRVESDAAIYYGILKCYMYG